MVEAPPRIVIAGTHSGAGKTTVASGLMAAFTARGYRVAPFKV
ncbi:MAG: AAA family ATPase, partial [Actinomycetota bacterium]|nr:AAA family ATPase [Actinomycetota bacterium]